MAESGLRPGLLVAMPASTDLTLSRAVLFLIRHGDDGSFGLIINQPSAVTTRSLFESFDMSWRAEGVVFRGGPVNPTHGCLLHDAVADPGAVALTPQIAMAARIEQLRALDGKPPQRFKMMLGSIDWAPGQLVERMSRGAVCADAVPELVFDTDPALLWERVQAIGVELAPARSIGARVRRIFGMGPAIPRATMRRK